MRGLNKLHLVKTGITDMGLKELEKLPLSTLNVRGCSGITDASIDGLGRLTGLQRLDLSDTQVTDGGIAELRKLLPRCEIVKK